MATRADVRFTGMCAGCPSAQMTLYLGVETALREEIPEFETLRAVAEGDAMTTRSSSVSIRTHVVVGRSARMRAVFDFLRVIGSSESTVLSPARAARARK